MACDSSNQQQLHIILFPFMAQGHILPLLDIAKLLTSRGLKTTLITTPSNAPTLNKSNQTSKINIKFIRFPTDELPENLDLVTDKEVHAKFFDSLPLLQEPLEQILQELHPNGIISDMFFPWTANLASKYGIPRLVFSGTSFFSMCCLENLEKHQPHKTVSSDTELFMMPEFPNSIAFSRSQLSDSFKLDQPTIFTKLFENAREAEKISFGTIVNSFYELEFGYVDYYRGILGKKAWHIGPVSLCNKNLEEKSQRGKESRIDEHKCIKWLDAKKPNSVLYVSFGSIANFDDNQLLEIALGLEASNQDFIWVVRREKNEEEKWLPNGYEKRLEDKGLIIRGWAPQILILDHQAIGGFVTHCGWNSSLEGVSSGLPMVTWPIFADQFFNEKLITDVLRIGVGVGAKKWVRMVGDFVESGKIVRAVKEVMVGEKAEEMRIRAKNFGELARRAIEEGGSSYNDLDKLIEDLKSYQHC
ncbi:scopoletin glucosyltransferase-like [Mercurialis annua]|uniref:scopoletin glucosyltransferase-like n=1 Tax=Mercurialis annua TaxID=3986 RepID=UPI00215E7807|nr:scopoletin glucosyltransferase-like [Mercurialis annua]